MQTTDHAQTSIHGPTRITANPTDGLARLMFYLRRVNACMETSILDDCITDYKKYLCLSASQRRTVLEAAEGLNPHELNDKIIVQDTVGYFSKAEVYSKRITSLLGDVVLLGHKVEASKALLCSSGWLEQYYTEPIQQLPETVFGTRHCTHCPGSGSSCTCTVCRRLSWSLCTPHGNTSPPAHQPSTLLEASNPPAATGLGQIHFLDATVDVVIAPSPPRPAIPQRSQRQASPTRHQAACDGCDWYTFTGDRFKCTICADYDLCQACYDRNIHLDTNHAFLKIETPGAEPDYLGLRHTILPVMPPPVATIPRSPENFAPEEFVPIPPPCVLFFASNLHSLSLFKPG